MQICWAHASRRGTISCLLASRIHATMLLASAQYDDDPDIHYSTKGYFIVRQLYHIIFQRHTIGRKGPLWDIQKEYDDRESLANRDIRLLAYCFYEGLTTGQDTITVSLPDGRRIVWPGFSLMKMKKT